MQKLDRGLYDQTSALVAHALRLSMVEGRPNVVTYSHGWEVKLSRRTSTGYAIRLRFLGAAVTCYANDDEEGLGQVDDILRGPEGD